MTPPSRRTLRPGRHRHAGQSLAIFAISALVIFGVMGLAVDTGLSYLAANRMERAAAAGALAGVTYMPAQYSTAVTAAQAAVARNGYTTGSGTTVAVYRVPQGCDVSGSTAGCAPNRLGVSVTSSVSNTFIRLLGFGPSHNVVQRATAEFLSTLTLGQPSPHLGNSAADINASPPVGYYFMRVEGWGTPRTEGDAYTTNPGTSTDQHALNSSDEVPDSTLTGLGMNALPPRGGYSYQVVVPSSQSGGARVQVYDAPFSPNGNPGTAENYHESDSTFKSGQVDNYSVMEYTLYQVQDQFDHSRDIPLSQVMVKPINATDPSRANWTDAITGTQLSTQTAGAMYQTWIDPAAATQPALETAGGGSCSSGANCLVTVNRAYTSALTAGTTYRLRVDVLQYDPTTMTIRVPSGSDTVTGHKGYAVRVVDPALVARGAANPECAACKIGGINELAFFTPLSVPATTTKQFEIPVVDVPPQYAGQTINVFAYDPGDTPGTNYLSIINPTTGQPACSSSGITVDDLGSDRSNTPVTVPSGTTASGQQPDPTQARIITAYNGNNNNTNGHWFRFQIPVAGSYSPGTADRTQSCSAGPITATTGAAAEFWSLRYELTNSSGSAIAAADTLTLAVSFDGPPVHLVPNG